MCRNVATRAGNVHIDDRVPELAENFSNAACAREELQDFVRGESFSKHQGSRLCKGAALLHHAPLALIASAPGPCRLAGCRFVFIVRRQGIIDTIQDLVQEKSNFSSCCTGRCSLALPAGHNHRSLVLAWQNHSRRARLVVGRQQAIHWWGASTHPMGTSRPLEQ